MELKVIFLEIVYLDLYSDKVWGFSIFSFCTPPGDIYGRSLLNIYAHTAKKQEHSEWTTSVKIARRVVSPFWYTSTDRSHKSNATTSLLKLFMFDGFFPQTSHDFLHNKRLLVFSFWFQALERVNCSRQSESCLSSASLAAASPL